MDNVKHIIVDAIEGKVKYTAFEEGGMKETSGNIGVILSDMIKRKAFADVVDLHVILPRNTALSIGYKDILSATRFDLEENSVYNLDRNPGSVIDCIRISSVEDPIKMLATITTVCRSHGFKLLERVPEIKQALAAIPKQK